jgi:membrane-associated protein
VNWLDASEILTAFGDWAVVAVAIIIFLETGFILTSFLPGDSLLFLTGLTMSNTHSWLPDWLGFVMVWVAAVAGSQFGYWVGKKIGPPLFSKNRNFILNEKVIEKTHNFFDRYGARAVILARLIPILRAMIPMLAGISKMDYVRFTKLNLAGGTLWVGLFMFPGYWLGTVPLIQENLEITVLIIVLATTLILPFELLRHRLEERSKAKTNSSTN